MRLSILHRTAYRYTSPVFYPSQQLRLTPRAEPRPRTLRRRLKRPGKRPRRRRFGHLVHTLALAHAHGDVEIEARGEVEVDALSEGRLDEVAGGPPPLAYLASTSLTEPDDGLRDFAERRLRGTNAHALLDFAGEVCGAIDYQAGTTEVTSTAAEALKLGRGVCQDHAHVFIAACRTRGLPARYVSGYVHPGDAPHAASHAWADVYLRDGGWVSIDVTHRATPRTTSAGSPSDGTT